MIQWYWALLMCVMFIAWTLLCVIVGAAISSTASERKRSVKNDPRLN